MKKIRRWGPGLLLVSPSILLVAVFVYGLIGWNIKVSLSDWRQAEETSGFDTSAFEGSLRRECRLDRGLCQGCRHG